jgi:hypothetical protein
MHSNSINFMNIEQNIRGESEFANRNSPVEDDSDAEDSFLMFVEDRSLRAAMPLLLHPGREKITARELHRRIAKRAYERFQTRGQIHGHDLEDWLVAERLVLSSLRLSGK